MDDADAGPRDVTGLAAGIVAAYVSNNRVTPVELPGVLQGVHAALTRLMQPAAPEPEKLTPPVPIRKSVTPDHLISLEDGKPYKSLKRHLNGRGLTPEQYRQKWGLPHDYPMVAANYTAQRSELARSLGLGQKRREAAAAAKAVAGDATVSTPAPKRRGRPPRTAA